MWWTYPFWLLALVFILPVMWLGGLTVPFKRTSLATHTKQLPITNHHSLRHLTILRIATMIAVILALAGTSVLLPSQKRQVVFLLDVSSSIGEEQIEQSRTKVLRMIKGLASSDEVAIVIFAGQPSVLTGFLEPSDASVILESALLRSTNSEETNLQAAIKVGVELLRKTEGNRSILLISDGNPTIGGKLVPVIMGTEVIGIPIHTIPIGVNRSGLVSQGLELPKITHSDESLLTNWRVIAHDNQDIMLSLKIDGQQIQRNRMRILQGDHTIPIVVSPQNSGLHQVELEAATLDGKIIPQSLIGGIMKVSGPVKILVIHGDSTSTLAHALTIQGIQVDEQGITGLPDNSTRLDGYGAVILDNVSAHYLSETQQQLLQNYITDGGGLLVIGGDASLGRGEYYTTRLEELLPVQTDTRQRLFFPRVDILFVIDHSGSMTELVGEKTKQLVAMQGVAAAIRELKPQDEVGVLSFDTQANWIIHFTPASQQNKITHALSGMGEGGGTDMAVAMQEVISEFSEPRPSRRHVVILTDGNTGLGNYQELCRQLKALQVTVSTIGIGKNIDEELLRNVAKWCDGQFYRANLDQIPRIIQKETIRISRDLIQEGEFKPSLQTPSPELNEIANLLPTIQGYLITRPKNLATVYLKVGKDPLLAGWRYGNGRVIVFTSDSGRRWLASWSGNQIYNRFWSQIIRSIVRPNQDEGLRVSVNLAAANAHIIVDAIGPDRRLRPGLHLIGRTADNNEESFIFNETVPGRYEANVELSSSGIQRFEVKDQQSANWTNSWVWNPPGAELLSLGPDESFLRQLSATSGGKFLVNPNNYPGPNWTWATFNLRNWFIILALLLFLIELGYRSISLGQLDMARAIFVTWWAELMYLVEKVQSLRTFNNITEIDHQRQTTEAYRYLAEHAREQREAQKKSLP